MKRSLRIYAPEQVAQSNEKSPSGLGADHAVPQGVQGHDILIKQMKLGSNFITESPFPL